MSSHHTKLTAGVSSEESICNVIAGASCEIQFSKDGVVKSLAAKRADADGSVSWSWGASELGLTSGEWTITAIASLDGQTKTVADALPLEVN